MLVGVDTVIAQIIAVISACQKRTADIDQLYIYGLPYSISLFCVRQDQMVSCHAGSLANIFEIVTVQCIPDGEFQGVFPYPTKEPDR